MKRIKLTAAAADLVALPRRGKTPPRRATADPAKKSVVTFAETKLMPFAGRIPYREAAPG
jgi:hypothetical protein